MFHSLKILMLFAFILLRVLSFYAALIPQVNVNETQLKIVKAFKSIINDKIENHQHFNIYLAVSYNETKMENKYFFQDLTSQILLGVDKRPVDIKFQTEINFKTYRHYQLIFVDDIKALRFLYSKLKQQGTRNLSYALIYISTIKMFTDPQAIEAFELLWKLHVLNVALIVPCRQYDDDADFVMITYFPYGPKSCEIIKPKLINRFHTLQRLWENRNYFPEKIRNFHGCPLIGAIWEDMPFLKIKQNVDGKTKDFIGIEGSLLKFIAENLNYTSEFYKLNAEERRETLNATSEIFKKLFRNNIKYLIGSFHSRIDINNTFDFSQSSYYWVSNTYLVVSNVHKLENLKMLFRPLQPQVWLMIGFIFMVGYVVIFTLRFGNPKINAHIIGQRNSMPFYNMFVTFVGGQNAKPLPQYNFARFLLMLWLILTFVLRGAYQSGLFEILRDQNTNSIPKTLNEVAARNYVIEMIPENVRFLTSLPEVKHVRFLNSTNELQEFPSLAASTKRIALLTSYEYFGHFRKINQSISRRLSLVRERIFALPMSFFMQRNSFLLQLFNDQITLAQKYGFIQIWKRQYMAERLESELDNGRATASSTIKYGFDANNVEVKLRTLSLRELDEIFLMCGYLLIFACGVFILEFIYAKVQNRKYKLTLRI